MHCQKRKRVLNHKEYMVLAMLIFLVAGALKGKTDTTYINSLTKEAYNQARKDADQSIYNAHKALAEARKINYKKGMADAQLALGSAYLAKFNPNDSATWYYHRALTIYKQTGNYTGMGRVCYGLSYLYNFQNKPDSAKEYGNLSIQYFEKAANLKEAVSALAAVVYLEKQAVNLEKALELSDKAIEMARSIQDTAQLANALNNKGNVLKEMYLLNPAIDAYFKAYKLWEQINDTSGLAIAYGSIANAWFFEGDNRKSLEYNFKKLAITKNTNNHWETNKTFNNISLAYSNLNQNDSALYYMHKSLNTAKKMNYPEETANCYNFLALTFLKMEETDSAFFYSSKAVEIAEKIRSPKLASYLVQRSEALLQQKKYNEALVAARKAYQMANQKNNLHTLKDAAFVLNTIYFRMNKPDLAYPFLTEYIQLNDSLKNMEFMRKVTRLDIQHEFDKKQRVTEFKIIESRQQIEILNQTNEIKSQRIKIFWIIIIATVLLSLAGAFISLLVINNQNHRIEQMKMQIRNYLLNSDSDKTEGNIENPVNILIEKYGLTPREAEVMELISTGIRNEEIANKMFVSKNTVKYHIKNIFIKLDVKNRVQAMQKSAL